MVDYFADLSRHPFLTVTAPSILPLPDIFEEVDSAREAERQHQQNGGGYQGEGPGQVPVVAEVRAVCKHQDCNTQTQGHTQKSGPYANTRTVTHKHGVIHRSQGRMQTPGL